MDLLSELKAVINALEDNNIEYALCGGLALAVYARPRATLDIDILVKPAILNQVKQIVEALGFTIQAPPMNFKDGGIQIHRITKINETTGEHLILDILLVTSMTSAAWESKVTVEWEGGHIKVLSPEGLIHLKSIRNSGQDKEDIDYLQGLINEN
jgi:hypothetical protein